MVWGFVRRKGSVTLRVLQSLCNSTSLKYCSKTEPGKLYLSSSSAAVLRPEAANRKEENRGSTTHTMAEETQEVGSGPSSNPATVAPPGELTMYTRAGGRFVTPWPDQPGEKPGFMSVVKFLAGSDTSGVPSKKHELDQTLPILKPDIDLLNKPTESGIRVTWIGHSTVLVQMENITFLTDPIFSQRAAMIQVAGPKRYRDPACKIEELPKVDAVVISHTHYDHLDYNSVKALNRRFGADLAWFVPLGNESWMKDAGCKQVYGLDWWQEQALPINENVKFAFTPAKHWSQRSLTDKNKVLWGSWCVLGAQSKFFFAGDTGICDVFKQIGQKYGPFDLAAIPVGAYTPRELMARIHVNPAEAVQLHQDLRAKKSLAIHWGTFNLAKEFYLDPPEKAKEAMTEQGLNPDDFIVVKHGETREVQG